MIEIKQEHKDFAKALNMTDEELSKIVSETEQHGIAQGHTSDKLISFVNMQVRRKLKLSSMKPKEKLTGLVIGDSQTDWGAIRIRKNNNSNVNADGTIIKPDVARTIVILTDNGVEKITQKSTKAITVPPIFETPSVADITVIRNKGQKQDFLNWDDSVSTAIVKSTYDYDKFVELIKTNDTLKNMVIPKLSILLDPANHQKLNNQTIIFKANILETVTYNNGGTQITIDDESLGNAQSLSLNSNSVNFTDYASDVIFICSCYVGAKGLGINLLMSIPREEDKKVEVEELGFEDIKTAQKQSEVDSFLQD